MANLGTTVRRTRFFVLAALRTTAVVMILIGLYGVTQIIMQVISFGGLNALTAFYGEGFSWTGYSAGFLVPGIALALLSGRLSRWITPLPRRACLHCSYELRNLQADSCPECGTPVD